MTRSRRVFVVMFVAFGCVCAGRASQTFGLHTAIEARAGYASDDSLWTLDGDQALYDLAATIRPLYAAQRDAFRFVAEVEVNSITGDTVERSVLARPVEGGRAGGVFDLETEWSSGDRHRAEARIDRLSVAWSPEWGTVTAGRHAVTWGGGLVFNPFDLFNPFAPSDVVRDYKLGADMLHVDVPLADGGWQALAVGRRDLVSDDVAAEASSFAAQWQRRIGDNEITGMAAWHYDEPALGLGVSGLLGEASWRIDATWLRVKPELLDATDDYVAAVANLQYSWVWGGRNVLGFLEYHYSGLGHGDYREALLDPFLASQLSRGNVFVLGRHYAAASLQVELHPLWNLWLSAITNLQDPSMLLQPRLVWNTGRHAQVLIGLDVPLGARGSEFGGIEVPLTGRTTRAPVTAYCRITWDW